MQQHPPHPLAMLLDRAARGLFPAPDGTVDVFGPPPGPCDAVVAFSAHNVVAGDVDANEVLARLPRATPEPRWILRFSCGWASGCGRSRG